MLKIDEPYTKPDIISDIQLTALYFRTHVTLISCILQPADVAGDEEEREVIYDRMDLFAPSGYQLQER